MRDLTTYDDQALLDELRQGHATAFTEIYRRYWRRLFVVACNRLDSRQAAEDVVHEVFTSLWKNRESSVIRSLYAYLATATKYAVYREIGRSARNKVSEPADIPDAPAVDLRFLEQMIAEGVHHLPEKCRLVFRYSREAGLSNKEIAHRLGISEKAVEKHITKAISQLRGQLRHLFHIFF